MRAGENQIALVTGGGTRAILSGTGLQLDVPVGGTAVQTGSHDATPGRLARLFQTGGLFGLGVAQGNSLGAVPSSADGVATAGLYRTDSTTTNLPQTAASGLLEVFHGAGNAIHQRWTATSADAATRCWQRRAAIARVLTAQSSRSRRPSSNTVPRSTCASRSCTTCTS